MIYDLREPKVSSKFERAECPFKQNSVAISNNSSDRMQNGVTLKTVYDALEPSNVLLLNTYKDIVSEDNTKYRLFIEQDHSVSKFVLVPGIRKHIPDSLFL